MKVYVTEMPTQQSDCPFCQYGECGICHNECIVEECCCLEQLVVITRNVEEVKDAENVSEN